MNLRARCACLSFVLAVAMPVPAQVPLVRHLGAPLGSPGYSFRSGHSGELVDTAVLGDVDGDAVLDFAAGAWSNGDCRAAVAVVSGATGTILRAYLGAGNNWGCLATLTERIGYALESLGDVTGDGIGDFVTAAGWPGPGQFSRVLAIDGATGALLWTQSGLGSEDYFGSFMAALGDLDGDGFGDVAIGAPFVLLAGQSGVVRLYSGATGAVLRDLDAPGAGGSFGRSVSRIADLDGDGLDDVLVGSPTAFKSGVGYTGAVSVHSSATGAALLTRYGLADGEYFGLEVSNVGDWSADGLEDYAVFRYAAPRRITCFPSSGGAFLGQYALPAPYSGPSATGVRLISAGDVDGDGAGDLAVGLWTAGAPGAVAVVSYVGGVVVQSHPLITSTLTPNTNVGLMIADLGPGSLDGGDWNGDGRDDLALHGQGAGVGEQGFVAVLPADCLGARVVCSTTPNSVGAGARIGWTGSLEFGANDLTLEASACPPLVSGLFFYGPTQASTVTCASLRCVGGPFRRFPILTTSSAGQASQTIDYNAAPVAGTWLPETTWYAQFWYRDPQGPTPCGTNYSDALELPLCP